jgi:hypothetical protein
MYALWETVAALQGHLRGVNGVMVRVGSIMSIVGVVQPLKCTKCITRFIWPHIRAPGRACPPLLVWPPHHACLRRPSRGAHLHEDHLPWCPPLKIGHPVSRPLPLPRPFAHLPKSPPDFRQIDCQVNIFGVVFRLELVQIYFWYCIDVINLCRWVVSRELSYGSSAEEQ